MADHPITSGRRGWGLALAAGLLLFSGCAADGSQVGTGTTIRIDAAPEDGPSTTTTRVHPQTGVPVDGKVHVLDSGSEPRQDLHRPPTVGTTQMTMRQSSDISMSSGGQEQSASTPAITQTMEVEVQPRPGGGFSLRREVIDAEVAEGGAPGTQAQLEASIGSLVGMQATGTIDAQGRTSDLDIDLPEDAPAATASLLEQMEGTFEQLDTPLPDEPVGAGASWATRSEIDLLGAEVQVEIVFTLASVDGEGYTVRTLTTMTIDGEQDMEISGQTARLVTMIGEGSGVVTVRFGQQVSEGRATSRVRQSFEVAGDVIDQDITQEVEFRPDP